MVLERGNVFLLEALTFFFLSLFVYFERERERERAGKEQREGVSTEPDAGVELTSHEIVTLAETKSLMPNQLSHPGTPRL